MDLPTRLDYYQLARQRVLQRAQRIDPTMVDVAGSDVNIVVGVGSVLADAVTKQIGFGVARLYLDGAYDEDLDRLAWDRYQLPRKGASPATGTVRFYRGSATGGAGTIPVGTVLTTLGSVGQGQGAVTYITTSPVSFTSTQTDQAIANVQATQAGHASQVGQNTIQRIQNPNALFDPTIQVNNDGPTAGGEEVEDDDTFKARIRSFWTTARRGTLGAIQFGALTVPGVVTAFAQEALNTTGQPARIVNLYIADSSGVASSVMANQVAIALNDYRAAGITVLIWLSIPTIQGIALNLAFATGVDKATLAMQIQAAVVEFVNSLPVSGTLYIGQLFSVLQRYTALGLLPNQSSIALPAGDVVPTPGQTIRTTPANVTYTTN